MKKTQKLERGSCEEEGALLSEWMEGEMTLLSSKRGKSGNLQEIGHNGGGLKGYL